MRIRSLVLPAVLAIGAALVAPAPAQAAPVQCELVLPSKVVIDAAEVDTDMWLTSGCYGNEAQYAHWDYRHRGSGMVVDNDFLQADLEKSSEWLWTWPDDAPMGRWQLKATGTARGDGTPLGQNDAHTTIEYGSKLATPVTRTTLTWAATATQ